MNREPRNTTEQDVIERLKNIPMEEVPADLAARVMDRVSSPKPSLMATLWLYISQATSISFRPIYAFGVALLVCGAFVFGRNSVQPPLQITTTSFSSVEVQAELVEDPMSAYLVGRGLLRANINEGQALAFLQRASLLEPENPEFAYWEGVGYWANGDKEKERESYLKGLEVDPKSIPLLINLGHSYLGDKMYSAALEAYRAVLAVSPVEPVALYNSGLIYRAMGMTEDEKKSWRTFLQYNRVGSQAFRAVQRLNDYDDFAFRSYVVGGRKVILNQQALLDESLSESRKKQELLIIASILETNAKLNLEVVVFVEHDQESAKKRALQLKDLIVENSSMNLASQVKLSWFDTPETIQRIDTASGVDLSEGLLVFSRPKSKNEREVSI